MHLLYVDDNLQATRLLTDQLSEAAPSWTVTSVSDLGDAENVLHSTGVDILVAKNKIGDTPSDELF